MGGMQEIAGASRMRFCCYEKVCRTGGSPEALQRAVVSGNQHEYQGDSAANGKQGHECMINRLGGLMRGNMFP